VDDGKELRKQIRKNGKNVGGGKEDKNLERGDGRFSVLKVQEENIKKTVSKFGEQEGESETDMRGEV